MIPRKLQRLAEEYRRSIAAAIGVSPEDINPQIVERWVREWTRAFLTPEAFRILWGHNSPTHFETATTELFKHVHEVANGRNSDVVVERRRGAKGL